MDEKTLKEIEEQTGKPFEPSGEPPKEEEKPAKKRGKKSEGEE